MCGRYSLYPEDAEKELRAIIQQVSDRLTGGAILKTGELFPTNLAPVLLQGGAEAAGWGFPNFRNSGVIINARAETAPEKPMFRQSILTRRCVVPSTGFFEWRKEESGKQKYRFQLPGAATLYMAGFYNDFQGERRFVILTTEANQSIRDVHNRMPVVLTKNQIEQWLNDQGAAMGILHTIPPPLKKEPV